MNVKVTVSNPVTLEMHDLDSGEDFTPFHAQPGDLLLVTNKLNDFAQIVANNTTLNKYYPKAVKPESFKWLY